MHAEVDMADQRHEEIAEMEEFDALVRELDAALDARFMADVSPALEGAQRARANACVEMP
jgi:hypothetical protein